MTGLSSCSAVLERPFGDYIPDSWSSLYPILGHVITVESMETLDYMMNMYIYIH